MAWFAMLRTAIRRHPDIIAFVGLVIILLSAWGPRSIRRADWDGGAFLIHPDEYHVGDRVTMTLRVPDTFGAYLRSECEVITGPNGQPALINPRDPSQPLEQQEPSPDSGCNTLNPRNLNFAREHVYGSLPTSTVRYLAEKLYTNDTTTPNQITRDQIIILGRTINTLMDLLIIVMIFIIGRYLDSRTLGLLAAFLYAWVPLPIQQAHFFTVDLPAAAYGMIALYFTLRLAHGGGWKSAIGIGLSLGLSVASKINMGAFVLIVILAAMQGAWKYIENEADDPWSPAAMFWQLWNVFWKAFGYLFLAGIVTLLTLRIAMPDAFRGTTFFDFRPDPRFLKTLANAANTTSGELDFPPSHQFANRTPYLHPWANMVVWGMGVPLGLAVWLSWLGMGIGLFRRISQKIIYWLPLWAWVTFYFFWQAGQPIQAMRYMLPIYGPLILIAAWGLVNMIRWAQKNERPILFRKVPLQAISLVVLGAVVSTTLFWGWGFSRIYERTHPRIAASEWVKRNIPPGSVISSDAWDIGISHIDGSIWPGVQVPIVNEDSFEKVEALLNTFDQVDYLAFTSNRAYGSLAQLPMRFPMSLNYFRSVFDGSLGFEKVADFTSYPSFLGIPISDEWAEEAWSVYDHPRVTIWRKTPAYSREQARQILLEDVNLSEVYTLKPIDATPIVDMLQLTTERWLDQRSAGSWDSAFAGFANNFPLIAWIMLIELIALAAWGILWRLNLPLPDRGLSLARMAGIVTFAFIAWYPAAQGWWAFSRVWLGFVALGFVAIGGWSIWQQRDAMWSWVKAHTRTIWMSQGLYWAGFGLLLLIRVLNPDLWHPAMGGEKPMNMAYLIATLKSQEFPPYDPWFAGGFMNYYYWGYILVGTPMKLLGLDPAIGFNLALPLLYGLGAQLAGGIGYNLLAPMRAGYAKLERRAVWVAIAAAVGVMLVGNLAQVVLYANGFRTIGNPELSLNNPEQSSQNLWLEGGSPVNDLLAGISARLDGTPLPFRPEWPYWNATRVIPGTINEFPFFSYLYGDLHAHVIALPMTLFTLLLVVGLWRGRKRSWKVHLAFAAVLGFCVGMLQATNTWDYPTYLLITAIGIGVVAFYATQTRRWRWRWIYIASTLALWYVIMQLAWAPFTTYFATGSYESLLFVMTEQRMVLREFLVLYGLWLWVIIPFLLLCVQRIWGYRGTLSVVAGLIAWFTAFWVLAGQVGPVTTPMPEGVFGQLIWKLRVSVIAEPIRQRAALWLIVIPLTILAATLLTQALRRRLRPQAVLSLAWITAGLGILIMSEIIVIPGAGRMNMVFKFGYQVWTLFALAAATSIPTLFRRKSTGERRPIAAWRMSWASIAALLLLGSLVYPATATPVKVADRYVDSAPRGLNGMAWMQAATWNEQGDFALASDQVAIQWLRQNVEGTPIILEGVTSPYRWNTRIATWTGLPSIIGWDGHQAQQRAAVNGITVVDRRKEFVREIYGTSDIERAQELLDMYGVGLIYVGPLERNIYSGGNLNTFDQLVGRGLWEVIFDRDNVRIYQRVGAAPVPDSLPPTFHPGVPEPDPLRNISLSRPPGELAQVNSTNDWVWLSENQIVAVILWILVFQLIGLLTWPIAALIFRSQGAAAWGFSRILGLLILGWLIWFPASLGFIRWTRFSVIAGLLVLGLLGYLAWQRGGATRIKHTWKVHRRALGFTEAVFWVLFIGWTTLRALNPDLWNPYWGGEKPFEFGFFNAIIRSPHMPPVDPFYSGGTINYYYYGLYLMTLPLKLLGLDSAIGFNLAVATVGALLGIGAWSVGLLIGRRMRFAVLALFMVALLGNIAAVIPSGQSTGIAGVVEAVQNCVGNDFVERPACRGLAADNYNFAAAFADAISNGSLDGLSQRLGGGVPWFWGPSRVLSSNATVINEFPAWSIIFADLHPHLIALPITLLIIGLAWEASRRRKRLDWLVFVSIALALGSLIASNAWDVPTYALLILLALWIRGWHSSHQLGKRLQSVALWSGVALGVILLAAMMYAPFLGSYRAPVGGIWPIRLGSPLFPWLLIYGPFVLVIVGWLFAPRIRRNLLAKAPLISTPAESVDETHAEANQLPTDEAILADDQMIAPEADSAEAPIVVEPHESAEGIPELSVSDNQMLIATQSGRTNRWIWVLAAFLGLAGLFLLQVVLSNISSLEAMLTASFGIRAVVIGLLGMLLLRLLKRHHTPITRWALVLATLGAAVALGVESVFVRDHLAPTVWESGPSPFERMNTVFKFGVQVWVLWALAAAFFLPHLLQRLRRTNKAAYSVWLGTLGLLGAMMLVFPIFGSISRIGTRFATPPPGPTLDGLAFMSTGRYSHEGLNIELQADGAAIDWLSKTITGTPVLLQSEEEFYRTYGVRIAANTGLPTIISALHGSEQRPASTVDPRIRDVQKIYGIDDINETQWLLHKYAVDYVYLGSLEQQRYPNAAQKFANTPALEQVYQAGDVTIYRTTPNLRALALLWRPGQTSVPPVSDNTPPPPPPPPAEQPISEDLAAALERQQQDPTNAGLAFETGQLLWANGRGDEAAEVLRVAADANPNDIALHHVLGDILTSVGRYGEAVVAFEQAYTAGPSAGNLVKVGEGYLAWSAIDESKLEDAERSFNQALVEDATLSDAHYFLGETYYRQAKFDEAREAYETYLAEASETGRWRELSQIRLQTLE